MQGSPDCSTPRKFVSIDTPAGFVERAFEQYKNRLSLGIPDPDLIAVDGRTLKIKYPTCRLIDKSGFSYIPNRDFLWITYGVLGELATTTARLIRSKVPRGSFVGKVYHSVTSVFLVFRAFFKSCYFKKSVYPPAGLFGSLARLNCFFSRLL